MRKQTYEEARVLQESIETLKGENDMLEDLSQQLEKNESEELNVHIDGVKLKQEASVHYMTRGLHLTPKELKDTVDERIVSNQRKITQLTNKFDKL